MKDHIIICGYGVYGRRIEEALISKKIEHVVIDKDPHEDSEGYIKGDARKIDTLEKAGIKEAKAIVIAVGEDREAAFITLEARELNPSITIVAKAERLESIDKIYFAGADKVVSPSVTGARVLAQTAIKPYVAEFLDRVIFVKDYEIAQLKVTDESKLRKVKIGDSRPILKNISILGIFRDGEIIPSPPGDETILEGDYLILLGKSEELLALQ